MKTFQFVRSFLSIFRSIVRGIRKIALLARGITRRHCDSGRVEQKRTTKANIG
jgi:hypothetical protein